MDRGHSTGVRSTVMTSDWQTHATVGDNGRGIGVRPSSCQATRPVRLNETDAPSRLPVPCLPSRYRSPHLDEIFNERCTPEAKHLQASRHPLRQLVCIVFVPHTRGCLHCNCASPTGCSASVDNCRSATARKSDSQKLPSAQTT